MLIAAFLLDEAGESELADFLWLARPEHARDVATGVAVHALRRGHASVWDALLACDAMDLDQAGRWFESEAVFEWAPAPEMMFDQVSNRG